MKKIILVLILISLTTFTFAENEKGLRMDAEIGAAFSLFSTYVTAHPKLMYDLGFPAIGGGVAAYFGTTFSDIYIGPFASLELGWLYFDIGGMFKAVDPDEEKVESGYIDYYAESDIMPWVATGLAIPIFPIGPGKLGADISVGFVPTSSPVQDVDSGSVFGDFIGALFGTIILSVFDSAKFGASLFYTIEF